MNPALLVNTVPKTKSRKKIIRLLRSIIRQLPMEFMLDDKPEHSIELSGVQVDEVWEAITKLNDTEDLI